MENFITTEIDKTTVKTVEIYHSKTHKINTSLTNEQEKQLLVVLQNHTVGFAWDYKDMKEIHLDICTHHIYIKDDFIPIRKPQRRMNPTIKDIVKEELQKLLDARFIYHNFQ
jgi:hypothetical protein